MLKQLSFYALSLYKIGEQPIQNIICWVQILHQNIEKDIYLQSFVVYDTFCHVVVEGQYKVNK